MAVVRLYLIQHGEPLPKEENPMRPLSLKGQRDVQRVASACSSYRIEADIIYYSTKLRARQTAEIIGKKLGIPVEERAGIDPLDPVKPWLSELKNTNKSIMIAGHLPFLERLVSLLLTGKEEKHPVKFQQGGMVCLERSEESEWSLLWTLFPDQPWIQP